MSAFIELRDVHKSFGDNEVLRGVDLSVDEHQVVCLIGPSGCGKSTLLRCINALEPIEDGEIYIDGERVSGRGVDVNALRADVGIVFQSFNLFPHMSVLDNVSLAPRKVLKLSRDEADERAYALLDRIGLADKAHEYPDRLSGGQQQRVAIVRALAMQPRVMLLDEVTSALDPELVSEVLTLVSRARGRGHDDAARDARDGIRARGVEQGRVPLRGPRSKRKARPRRSSTSRRATGRAASSAASSKPSGCNVFRMSRRDIASRSRTRRSMRSVRTPAPPLESRRRGSGSSSRSRRRSCSRSSATCRPIDHA